MSLKIFALAEGVLKAMVLTKVKTISAVVVLVGVFGLVGLTGGSRLVADGDTPVAEAPASRAGSAPKKAAPLLNVVSFVDSGTVDTKRRLPSGPAPEQALVKLDGDKVVITVSQQVAIPKTTHTQVMTDHGVEYRSVTRYELTSRLFEIRSDRKDVQVRDTHNRKLDASELPKLLKKEIVAYVLVGSSEIDTLHLRLMKEGTLIFLIAERDGLFPPPAAIPAYQDIHPQPVNLPPPPSLVVPEQAGRELADRDLAIAKFYQNTGHPASAAFYYELILRRHPNSPASETAAKLLKELRTQATPKQGEIRVGQITIVGNNYLPDAAIREVLAFHPGEVLKTGELRTAEEKIRRLSKAIDFVKVSVSQPNSDRDFQDVLVEVRDSVPEAAKAELKKLQGSWVVTAAVHAGRELAAMKGMEFKFGANQITVTPKPGQKQVVHYFLLSPELEPKRLQLFALDGPPAGDLAIASYELDGGTLRIRLHHKDGAAPNAPSNTRSVELTLRRRDTP
jgi:uncharacterized protein (TIGR03067 family)